MPGAIAARSSRVTTRLETQGVGMRTAGWCAALLAGFCWLAAVPVLADEPPTLVEVCGGRGTSWRRCSSPVAYGSCCGAATGRRASISSIGRVRCHPATFRCRRSARCRPSRTSRCRQHPVAEPADTADRLRAACRTEPVRGRRLMRCQFAAAPPSMPDVANAGWRRSTTT